MTRTCKNCKYFVGNSGWCVAGITRKFEYCEFHEIDPRVTKPEAVFNCDKSGVKSEGIKNVKVVLKSSLNSEELSALKDAFNSGFTHAQHDTDSVKG